MFTYPYPHPAVTVDVVVLSRTDEATRVLLVRRAQEPFAGCWALPGGFVGIAEDLDDAARRELREETGLDGLTLRQLHAFGRPDRDPRERVISVAYYALLPEGRPAPVAGSDAAEAAWFDVTRLPALAFDHADIIATALRTV
jgi:8-oxo-dGTP diphosphatase